jgi:hypothetical protein
VHSARVSHASNSTVIPALSEPLLSVSKFPSLNAEAPDARSARPVVTRT